MTIEIYSDFVCPWCYIGWRKIQDARAELSDERRAAIKWRAFQLDPEADIIPGISAAEAMKGWYPDPRVAEQRIARINTAGADAGLALCLDKARPVNTMDAHRLAEFAERDGLGDPVREALFHSYHVLGENIADRGHLLSIADQTGLDRDRASDWLENDNSRGSIVADRMRASKAGVRSVPSLVVQDAEPISVMQAEDQLTTILSM